MSGAKRIIAGNQVPPWNITVPASGGERRSLAFRILGNYISLIVSTDQNVSLAIEHGRNSDTDGTDSATGLPWVTVETVVVLASSAIPGGQPVEIWLMGGADKGQIYLRNDGVTDAIVRVDLVAW